MSQREEVEFKTLDGLTLRGTLYPGVAKAPAVIMTPGFNTTKEMFLPKICQFFQVAGINVLVYDPRTIGASDGTPRNNIDPAQQVRDYHDALTFLKSDPRIDRNRIAFWGFSFSGAVALAAAALDRRAALVLAICPLTVWELSPTRLRSVLAKAMQDRESQLKGNKAFSIPMLTDQGENPAGFGSGASLDELHLINESKEMIPDFEATTTLQTYYNIMAWSPFETLRHLEPTPLLLVTPEDDRISPSQKQKDLIYDRTKGPKHMHLVPGAGHMDVLDGGNFGPAMDAQVNFIRHQLGEW